MIAFGRTTECAHQKLMNFLFLLYHRTVHTVLVQRIFTQITFRTGQAMATIILNVTLFTFHRIARMMHHHLLLLLMRCNLHLHLLRLVWWRRIYKRICIVLRLDNK